MTDLHKFFKSLRIITLCFASLVLGAWAQESSAQGQVLKVGTKESPPFSMKSEDGEWTGITIELWNMIGKDLNLSYEYQERDLRSLVEGVCDGSLDVAASALTITPEREKEFDFTHSFLTSGLGIAVTGRSGNPWIALLGAFFSMAFMKVVAVLALLILGVGFLVWWFEHRKNAAQFGKGVKGIGAGFWWSAVTMTTVGYGDKAPATMGGRVVALVWMFTGIIVISSFTAAIASSLTVNRLESAVKGPDDLPGVRVGSLPDSTSEAYLVSRQITFQTYNSVREGLAAVEEDKIDAFVYDAPIMRYMANQEFQGRVQVLPVTFRRQDYGIALPAGSPLRESINRSLLEKIADPVWEQTLFLFLGR